MSTGFEHQFHIPGKAAHAWEPEMPSAAVVGWNKVDTALLVGGLGHTPGSSMALPGRPLLEFPTFRIPRH